jgi:hypothetical protein
MGLRIQSSWRLKPTWASGPHPAHPCKYFFPPRALSLRLLDLRFSVPRASVVIFRVPSQFQICVPRCHLRITPSPASHSSLLAPGYFLSHAPASRCTLFSHKSLDGIPMATQFKINHGEMSTSIIIFCGFLAVASRSHSSPRFTLHSSPEPTAVGAARSAVAVRTASRPWLSFFR